ncbi:MAG: glycosyltransferase [Candidatus Nanohaloarchaea archaeon]
MIAVLVPTLNEEEAVKQVLEGFPEEYSGHELKKYVIDGGSTDATVEKAKEAGAEVLHQRLEGGKGDGVRQALNEIDADIYVMIDGDATYDPSEVGKLLEPILAGEAEHVIGWRTNRTPGSIPLLNRAGNRIFNLVTSFSTGVKVHDMLSGFRAFTKESLDYTATTQPGFGIETEMTFTAIENNVPLSEVEISYNERKGESKLHPVMDGWRIINTIIWSIRDMNPLKFFSVAALFMFVLASYPGYLTLMQKLQQGRITNLGPALFASLLAIIGVQLLIFGLLADQIKNVEKRLRNND